MTFDSTDEISGYTAELLETVNRTPIPLDDMILFVQETGLLEAEDRDFEGHTITAVRLFSGEPEKVQSIMFRMTALARLEVSGELPGWVQPERPGGAVMTHGAIFAAAAKVPLHHKARRFCVRPQGIIDQSISAGEED